MRSTVTWSALNDSFCSEVGTIATASLGHLKQVAPWPDVGSTWPRRTCTRNSDGFADTKPQRLVFSGSSSGLFARQLMRAVIASRVPPAIRAFEREVRQNGSPKMDQWIILGGCRA